MAFAATRDDRKRIHFKVFPTLAYWPRMLLALASIVAGVAVQLTGSILALIAGAVGVFLGLLLTMVDSKTNKPKGVRGKRSWERVTREEYQRVVRLVEEGKRWARRDVYGATNLAGCAVFLLLAVGLVVAFGTFLAGGDGESARIVAVDGALFLVLTFFAGARKAWQPGDLLVKIRTLDRFLDQQARRPIPRLKVQPMLEVQTGSKDRQLPRDARLLFTIDDAPEDLIGFQVQCSINRVSNTPYPYVYAVIIARKALGLGAAMARFAVGAKDVLSFEEADEEVDVAVLRQRTTKTSGYHTKEADQDRIFSQAVGIAFALAKD